MNTPVAENRPPQQHGLLVLNKPSGPTSAGCLEKIKRNLGQKKIGHAGTLDPLASGVLLVLLGQGTKIAQYLLEGAKRYLGTLELGVTTDTYDLQGQVVEKTAWNDVTEEQVHYEVQHWLSLTSQIVPPYSAAKHKGQPLYKLAREGKETPVKEKLLTVHRAEVVDIDLPLVRFRVECSSGAYVRSLVHSLGMRTGCGAALAQLTREYSRPFGLGQAWDLEQLLDEPEELPARVLPLASALPHWPRMPLPDSLAKQVRNGAMLRYGKNLAPGESSADFAAGQRAMFVDQQGNPLALVEIQLKDGEPVWSILRGLAA